MTRGKGRFVPSGMPVGKLFALGIEVRAVVVNVEKIPWHRHKIRNEKFGSAPLLQGGPDGSKLSGQPCANPIDDSDDHYSNTGGDQAVLDDSRTRFICKICE
jgi:hypothetical protein